MQQKITSFLLFACSAILALGVKTIVGPCPLKDPSKIMSCHHAGEAVFYLGLFCCILALLKIAFKKYAKLLDVLTLVSALATSSCMGITVNLCASSRMHCQLVMKPFVIVLALFILAVGIWDYCLQKNSQH